MSTGKGYYAVHTDSLTYEFQLIPMAHAKAHDNMIYAYQIHDRIIRTVHMLT